MLGKEDLFFLFNTTDFKKLYEFTFFAFETSQDLEYYNGFIFDCTTDGGVNLKYQSYSFYNYLDNIIYVYDVKLDKNNNPTKNFGRLIARLFMSGLGELVLEMDMSIWDLISMAQIHFINLNIKN